MFKPNQNIAARIKVFYQHFHIFFKQKDYDPDLHVGKRKENILYKSMR